MKLRNPIAVATYAVLFGGLMAARHETSGLWARALIAATAGVVSGLLLRASRGRAPRELQQPANRHP